MGIEEKIGVTPGEFGTRVFVLKLKGEVNTGRIVRLCSRPGGNLLGVEDPGGSKGVATLGELWTRVFVLQPKSEVTSGLLVSSRLETARFIPGVEDREGSTGVVTMVDSLLEELWGRMFEI